MGRRAAASKAAKKDIDPEYLRGTITWAERLAKYAELSVLEFYLTKYETAFSASATKFKEFQTIYDDDIERSEILKKELSEANWGENELKLALQAEANQYRFASEVSSRAAQCKVDIREIVQLAEFPKLADDVSVMAYIGEIIRERRKVEEENKIKRRKGAKRARELQLLKKQKLQQQQKPAQAAGGSMAGSAINPDLAKKRLEALQKIRELNAQRKAQRGDLNMY